MLSRQPITWRCLVIWPWLLCLVHLFICQLFFDMSQVVRRASTAETAPRSAAAKMAPTVTTSVASAPAELVSLGPAVMRVEYPQWGFVLVSHKHFDFPPFEHFHSAGYHKVALSACRVSRWHVRVRLPAAVRVPQQCYLRLCDRNLLLQLRI